MSDLALQTPDRYISIIAVTLSKISICIPIINHHQNSQNDTVNNLMEILSLNHNCLFFRFNKRKYLLGLTGTLALDPGSTRLKPDHVILPSFPFDCAQGLFLWHLPALEVINCHSLLVADLSLKKRLETLLPAITELAMAYKWEILKQHELIEEQLAKVYQEQRAKSIPKPLRVQPNGLAFNDKPQKLNFIVPQTGRSVLMLHQGDAILIDPAENIIGMLQYYGIPSPALKTVILTNANTLNIFELFFQPHPITLITSQQVYSDLKRQIRAYFHWDDAMVRQKMRANIMIHQQKNYQFGCIEVSFVENQYKTIESLDIIFGLKRVRLCPNRLLKFPIELIESKDLELLVVYDMQDPIKKELESSPAAYRKRVLFNRATRKYGNKYFCSITDKTHFTTIQAHPYAQLAKKDLFGLSFLFRQRDHNYRLQQLKLTHGQFFNAAERVIYVLEGYVRDEKGRLFGAPATVNGAKEVVGESNALIMHQLQRNNYFFEGTKMINSLSFFTGEDLLKKVKDNSFVKTLKRRREDVPCAEEEQVEMGSQWEILNSLCILRTFQAGCEVGRVMSLFLVVKGGLKWRSSEEVAGRGMGIGNVRKYYNNAYEDGDEMEAVKDSWAIQIPLKQLHLRFFSQFPTRMYQLFTKALMFE